MPQTDDDPLYEGEVLPDLSDENPMAVLARIALEERAEKFMEKQRKKLSRDGALRQMHKQEKDASSKRERFQAVCDHLLGNHRIGVIPDIRRCALHKDHLSNKEVRIYCGKCRFEWHPGDKNSVYHVITGRGRVEKPNPTRKGWKAINDFLYSFSNSNDLTSRAFRIERVEPEEIEEDELVPELV
jgi:hypothetical protein